jgi:hypothetical protein
VVWPEFQVKNIGCKLQLSLGRNTDGKKNKFEQKQKKNCWRTLASSVAPLMADEGLATS